MWSVHKQMLEACQGGAAADVFIALAAIAELPACPSVPDQA